MLGRHRFAEGEERCCFSSILIPPYLRWCAFEQGGARAKRCAFGAEWLQTVKTGAGDLGKVKAVGYMLRHGGDRFKQPVLRVTPQTLGEVEDAVRFLPEFNDITCKVLDCWTKELPGIPHFLFCDTAFFAGLPDVAGTYAVPEELRETGVRRYGSYGLVHQWAWAKARSLFGENVGKMVSVYLGDHTNLAALRDGQPLDTTIGFTPVEGIPPGPAAGTSMPRSCSNSILPGCLSGRSTGFCLGKAASRPCWAAIVATASCLRPGQSRHYGSARHPDLRCGEIHRRFHRPSGGPGYSGIRGPPS